MNTTNIHVYGNTALSVYKFAVLSPLGRLVIKTPTNVRLLLHSTVLY